MRTRRQYRPMFDHLALRIAPSGGVCADPMDTSSSPNASPPVVSPMDPTWTPPSGPDSGLPYAGPSDTTTLDPLTTTLC